MPLAWKPARLPKAHTTLEAAGGVTLRFYHGDCVEVLRAIEPGAVSAIVTSPPYNLGVSYRSYNDSLPRASYLEWSDAWIKAASRTLAPHGSLFLNVGAKPTDPWTAMEVAQTARRAPAAPEHDPLDQVDRHRPRDGRRGRGPRPRPRGRPLQADQQRPIRQRLPRVRLPVHARGPHAARPPRDRRALPGRVEHRPLADGRRQPALPRQHVVHPLRDDSEPRQGSPAPGDLPASPRRSTACGCTGSHACAW